MLIPMNVLKAAIPFASTDAYRPALNSIQVKGRDITSCDGHRLIRVTVPDLPAAEYPAGHNLEPIQGETLIPLDAAKQAVTGGPKPYKALPILQNVLLGHNGKPTLYRTTSQVVPFTAIERPYPDCDKVIPTTDPVFTVAVNASYAAEIFKALASLSDTTSHEVTIEFRDPRGPLVIRCEHDGVKTLVLLMPLQPNGA